MAVADRQVTRRRVAPSLYARPRQKANTPVFDPHVAQRLTDRL